ncbi:MAG: chemotaxis protein CheW [Chloroflexaceae bacterium]|nr:chemotaxis protein CheW [Chloroflexaceae bacterium]
MSGAVATTLAFEVHTGRRRYFVPRDHVDQLGTAPPPTVNQSHGRPLLARDLGPLLDPADDGAPGRQALTVLLRRRTVVLRVQRIESLASVTVHPLAPLLRQRLRAPWLLGAVITDDQPVLVLDVRRIATDVALGAIA